MRRNGVTICPHYRGLMGFHLFCVKYMTVYQIFLLNNESRLLLVKTWLKKSVDEEEIKSENEKKVKIPNGGTDLY